MRQRLQHYCHCRHGGRLGAQAPGPQGYRSKAGSPGLFHLIAGKASLRTDEERDAVRPFRQRFKQGEKRREWLGLGVRPDRGRAYAGANLARRAAQSYLEARLRVPGPEEPVRMEAEACGRSERIAHMQRHLGRLPDEEALLRRTAAHASELSSEKRKQLTRALGREASFGLKREIRRLLERDRGLAAGCHIGRDKAGVCGAGAVA